MSLGPGDRLGAYQILAPIGAGAMGEVYSACDDRLQRDVAIKVLPPSLSADPDRLRRFEQEAQAAGRLNHPNILAIYDIGTHEGAPFIVSELLEGETLQSRLAAGRLPAPTTIDFSMQLALGLAAAHDKGITHDLQVVPEAAAADRTRAERRHRGGRLGRWVYYLAGQYDRIIEVCRKAVDLDPNYWPAHAELGLGYEKVGRFADAVASLQRARQLDNSPTILEMLGGAYAAWGKKEEARKVLAELAEQAAQHYVCPYEVATVHAGLGDRKATLEWLEKGYQERADCMPWVRSDPKLNSLRGDPQFEDLLRRMGLPR
jgi:tetratricopeptide (TPR) repeat protein